MRVVLRVVGMNVSHRGTVGQVDGLMMFCARFPNWCSGLRHLGNNDW